jgi:RNA polymerase sigma factor (sigma-70 family)
MSLEQSIPEPHPETEYELRVGDLVGRVRQGDEPAMSELMAELTPTLYGYLRRRTNHHETAEDLTQQTLITTYEKFLTFQGTTGRQFTGWTNRVALNHFRDHLRAIKIRPADSIDANPEFEADMVFGRGDLGDPTAELVLNRVYAASLLGRITTRAAQIMYLTSYAHLTTSEVAQHLNIALGTVKSGRFDALKQLRLLAQSEQEETDSRESAA